MVRLNMAVKYTVVIAIPIAIIFLVSCTGVEEKTKEIAAEPNLTAEKLVSEEPAVSEPSCTAGWQCLDSDIKAYRLENCSFVQQKECPSGCGNGTCIIKTCTPGWKCKGEYYKGYQTEGCEWIKKTKCEFGCDNAECQNASVEEETGEGAVIVPTYDILVIGESKTFTINEQEHTLSIFNIGDDGVQISLDDKKSPWMTDNSNYTAFGVTVLVKDIFFQSYPGGKKEITYRIN